MSSLSFSEIRFPDDISFETSGGPTFVTDIIESGSGYERRNTVRNTALRVFKVKNSIKSASQVKRLLDFFVARRGKSAGFRFKDWSDYSVTNQVIGFGDGITSKFKFIKVYGNDSDSYIRDIQKLVTGTVTVYLDNIVSNTATVDHENGFVTFLLPVPSGVAISADFEFDIPARFDVDELVLKPSKNGSGFVEDIIIKEILIR